MTHAGTIKIGCLFVSLLIVFERGRSIFCADLYVPWSDPLSTIIHEYLSHPKSALVDEQFSTVSLIIFGSPKYSLTTIPSGSGWCIWMSAPDMDRPCSKTGDEDNKEKPILNVSVNVLFCFIGEIVAWAEVLQPTLEVSWRHGIRLPSLLVLLSCCDAISRQFRTTIPKESPCCPKNRRVSQHRKVSNHL